MEVHSESSDKIKLVGVTCGAPAPWLSRGLRHSRGRLRRPAVDGRHHRDPEKIRTLVDQVNLGSRERARGFEQIGTALAQMDRVTQTNAANAEESDAAVGELTAHSEALREIVRTLTAMEAREQDHRRCLDELRNSVHEQRPFTLTTGPHQCAFGEWYESYPPPPGPPRCSSVSTIRIASFTP